MDVIIQQYPTETPSPPQPVFDFIIVGIGMLRNDSLKDVFGIICNGNIIVNEICNEIRNGMFYVY